jgi:hypothetical protein
MPIEARGAKTPYAYSVIASKVRGNTHNTYNAIILDVADSDDEAFGKAMKLALHYYPPGDGWQNHFAIVLSIGGLDWVEPHVPKPDGV